MATEIKKMRYFDGLFLKKDEFILDQDYHTGMRYRHNRYLHSCGIVYGLEVFALEAKKVRVSQGMALNKVLNGGEEFSQEIILTADSPVDLQGFAPNDIVYLYISHSQVKADTDEDKGGSEEIHWWERAIITASKTEPVDENTINIMLAKVLIKADGTIDQKSIITEEGGNSLRIYAGFAGKAIETGKLTLTIEGATANLASIEGKQLGSINGIQINSPTTNFSGDLTVTGKVDGRDISADGTKLDSHVANKNNPHEITASLIGALPLSGGTLSGNLSVSDSDLFVSNGNLYVEETDNWYGIYVNNHGASDVLGIAAIVSPPGSGGSAMNAAVSAYSGVSGVYGVYAEAPNGTHALYVNGTATFTGAKTGYVVDVFINRSGQRLHTGDIVKLKGTPISRFQGDNNKIPVAEVTLADQENDGKIIGVVDCEAPPRLNSPDTRTEPDDPTFIEEGGELFVVTLGAYAHCKVDAAEAPIEVGDLLTSSANPGYAKKATDPKIGSIIGKALEPLESGTGYISIFVNIQ